MPKRKKGPIKNLGSWAGVKKRRQEPVNNENIAPVSSESSTDISTTMSNCFDTYREPEPEPLRQMFPSFGSVLQTQAPPAIATSGLHTGWESEESLAPSDTGPVLISDNEEISAQNSGGRKCGQFVFPLTVEEAHQVYLDIGQILKPRQADNKGFTDPNLDCIKQKLYPGSRKWQEASLESAKYFEGTAYLAMNLQRWTHEFVNNPEFVPEHCQQGKKGQSAIDDEDFAQELHLYLQSVGEYCNLDDIIKYVTQPDVLERLGQKKTISKDTASRWMKKIGYRWTLQP
ncbi:hypothetical protein BDQ17DRAFT_1438365 [Cyathus striatus]|nr:hypothetical protein BDQ17DRAFT_1438365 [Cyathus striatus]